MSTIEIGGRTLEVDADGNLSNLSDWNEEIARELAKREGIEELNEEHNKGEWS